MIYNFYNCFTVLIMRVLKYKGTFKLYIRLINTLNINMANIVKWISK